MKNKILVIISFSVLLFMYSNIYAGTGTAKPITHCWHTAIHYVYAQPCFGEGTGCTVCETVLIIYPFSMSAYGNGTMLQIPISGASHQCTPDTTTISPYEQIFSSENYTFGPESQLVIETCDNPDLIGLTLDVGGMTTDNNGILNYYLPF